MYDNAGDPMQVITVPTSFRPRILYLAHEGSGHMGVEKCHSLISAKFTWPGMGKDNHCIASLAKNARSAVKLAQGKHL